MSEPPGNPRQGEASGPSNDDPGVNLVVPIQQFFATPATSFTNVFTTPGSYNITVGFNAVTGSQRQRSKIPRPVLQAKKTPEKGTYPFNCTSVGRTGQRGQRE